MPVPVPSMFRFTVALVALVAVARMGSSMYLPSLTHIQHDLKLSDQALASTMTIYFACFSLFSLVAGPLSDARGRRGLVYGGLAVYAAGTIACGLASGLELLLVGRAMQAIGGGTVMVVTRAMVRDACDDEQMVTVVGWMGVLNSLAPILAPVLGGVVTEYAGWRANFDVLVLMGLALAAWSWRYVPETLAPAQRTPLDLGFTFRQFLRMLTSKSFMGALMPALLCFALQGAYLALGPLVFVRQLGLSPVEFGLTNIPLLLALVAGRSVCMRLLRRLGPGSTVVFAGGLILLSGLMALGVLLSGVETVAAMLVPTLVFCLGFGTMLPLVTRSVMTDFQDVGGTASAMYTSMMLAASAVGSALGGHGLHASDEYQVLVVATVAAGPLVFASCLYARRLIR